MGMHGPGVALLQGSLVDLGCKLPNSTRKKGTPDGLFGFETQTVLTRFQVERSLKPDGRAGAKTIALLDALMVAKAKPKPPPPAAAPVSPPDFDYKLGAGDPPLRHDAGAGRWNSKPRQATYAALKLSVEGVIPAATVVIGRDAAKHMSHYLGNTGARYNIDLEGMVREVPSARERYEDEVAQAQGFVEQLPVGRHEITSKQVESGYNYKEENWNWFYAIGGYSTWGKGVATVKNGTAGPEYLLEFEYKFYDRYNWDKGKSVKIFKLKITDEFMSEFHLEGLAQEFDCHGSFKRTFSWKKGESIKPNQAPPAGGRGAA
jgi:hypothetical protein